jgi:cytochrome c2
LSAAKKNAGVAVAALGLLFAVSHGAAQTGDAARGAKVFQACAACHSVKAGESMTGPCLAHIWNGKARASDDFQRYSDAMKNADMVWNASTLDKWLANPERFLPGSAMTLQNRFEQGGADSRRTRDRRRGDAGRPGLRCLRCAWRDQRLYQTIVHLRVCLYANPAVTGAARPPRARCTVG